MENHANSTEELAGEFVQEEVGEDDNNEDLSETKGNDDINQEREMTEVENDQSDDQNKDADTSKNRYDDDNHRMINRRVIIFHNDFYVFIRNTMLFEKCSFFFAGMANQTLDLSGR